MRPGRIIVVTGTDTEVGKTFVTAGLARFLTEQGRRIIAIKPVESGVAGEAVGAGEDGALLATATGQRWPTAALQRLRTPVAPPVAAELEGVTLTPGLWTAQIRRAAQQAEIVLVEGAGGLLSPLAAGYSALGLALALEASVFVVGADRLGTLNHALLTLRTLETAGLAVQGVALSTPASADASTGRNADALDAAVRQSAPAPGSTTAATVVVPRDAGASDPCWAQLASRILTLAAPVGSESMPTEGASNAGPAMAAWASARVEERRRDGLLRRTAALDRNLVNFSGNDYLGLSSHPRVIDAASRALREAGMGPRGSALICGYTDAHAALEARIAEHCGTEAALLFPTGYAANVATVTALGGPDCALFSDALNHASIIDGCRLARRAGTEVHVYPHGDTQALASQLAACDRPRRIILTESVFSMDGDRAPLDELAQLRDQHDAWLVCDEAHATLLFPPHPGVDLYIGTLSKAVGTLGGFAACPAPMRELLLNAGRPFVFSTALPVPVVRAAHASFDVAAEEPHHLARLRTHIAAVAAALNKPGHTTPIVPVVLGAADDTMAASAQLRAQGFHIPGIRPPTVPRGTSRLRIALAASHTEAEIAALISAVAALHT